MGLGENVLNGPQPKPGPDVDYSVLYWSIVEARSKSAEVQARDTVQVGKKKSKKL